MAKKIIVFVMIGIGTFSILLISACASMGGTSDNPPPYPEFPWPPPQASAFVDITNKFAGLCQNESAILGDLDSTLCAALGQCEYVEKSYFAVPGGFALVTRLEQINPDGSPKDLPDRWSIQPPTLRVFSLSEYLKALFTANSGYYRIIVFIVTPHAFSQSDQQVSSDEAEDWLVAGLNKLPEPIANLPLTEQYSTTALIYEFKSLASQEATINLQSRLTGRIHLQKSGILPLLER